MAALVDMITGPEIQAQKAAAFGCYGWSGESVKVLNDHLARAGFDLLDDKGLKALWQPGDDDQKRLLPMEKRDRRKILIAS